MLANFLGGFLFNTVPSFYFWIQRQFFVGDQRRTFYLQLGMLMRNGLMQKVALEKLVDVYGQDGERPHRTKAVVSKECLDGLSESNSVADTLFNWVPFDEFQLLDAGQDGKGGLEAALTRAAEVVERKGKMRATLVSKLSNPAVQFVGVILLLYYIAEKALPQLLRMTKQDSWDFTAWAMAFVASAVANYGTIIAGGLVVSFVFTIWSIPNLTGAPRLWLERIPPWSIVCRMWGATFLYNYSLLQSSGRMGRDILAEAIETSNPYMAERMQGALVGVKNGKNIGDALHLAGYNFPSREALEFTRAIASQQGGQDALMKFTNEWLDETVREVAVLADFLNLLVMLFNFSVLIFVLSGASSMGMAAMNDASLR